MISSSSSWNEFQPLQGGAQHLLQELVCCPWRCSSSSGPRSFAFCGCCCLLGIDVSSQGLLISVLKNDFRVWKEEAEMDGLLAFLLADGRGGRTRVTHEATLPPKDGSCEEARSPLLDTPADLFLVVQTVETWNVRSELHRLLQMPPLFFRESKILLKP